jgi:deoxyadenosine/deoxycytidine kinase
VCILGIIGSGKTTLAQALQKVIAEKTGRCEGLWEPVESNPLLPLYYKDPERYALSMQIYMLNRRMEQQRVAQDLALMGVSSVQDSSLFGDSCFVEMLRKDGILKPEEVDVYSQLFANMSRDVMYPSLVIYLDCEPETAKRRIEKRGRECEKGISIEYLAKLKAELDVLIDDFADYTNVHRIDANADLTPEQIDEEARGEFMTLKILRGAPILSRMGV